MRRVGEIVRSQATVGTARQRFRPRGSASRRGAHPTKICARADKSIRSRGACARERCQTAMSNGPYFLPVARIERSEIRDDRKLNVHPGFHGACHRAALRADPLVQPRLRRKKIKEAERRQTHLLDVPHANGARVAPRKGRLAPPFRSGRARLPAFHPALA